MSEFYEERPLSYPAPPKSTDDESFGPAWSVRREDGKYFFEYISGELAGRQKQIEITAADYDAARGGEIDGDGLCVKYGVS
jgi:hypothetical protein